MSDVSGYLGKAVEWNDQVMERASKIAEKGPAMSLQIIGMYMISGATLVRVMSSVRLKDVVIGYSTLDFAITILAGVVLFFGGAYISLVEYRNKVRWYEMQLGISNQTTLKAFEIVAGQAKKTPGDGLVPPVLHTPPPPPPSPPTVGG